MAWDYACLNALPMGIVTHKLIMFLKKYEMCLIFFSHLNISWNYCTICVISRSMLTLSSLACLHDLIFFSYWTGKNRGLVELCVTQSAIFLAGVARTANTKLLCDFGQIQSLTRGSDENSTYQEIGWKH